METADNRHLVESQPVIVLRFQILPPELVSRTRAELSGLDPTTMIPVKEISPPSLVLKLKISEVSQK